MLPAAMPADVAAVPVVVTFTRKAPNRIPGQMRCPSRRYAAKAIPAGGHTVVAVRCTKAKASPSLPKTK